jgi:hypothetical protein
LQWGSAADNARIYVNNNNYYNLELNLTADMKPVKLPGQLTAPTKTNGSIAVALNAWDGSFVWTFANPLQHWAQDQNGNVALARSQAPMTVANGVVYFASMDINGVLYYLNAVTGAVLGSFATGATNGCGPSVVDGRVFVGSGYINFGLGKKGQGMYALQPSTTSSTAVAAAAAVGNTEEEGAAAIATAAAVTGSDVDVTTQVVPSTTADGGHDDLVSVDAAAGLPEDTITFPSNVVTPGPTVSPVDYTLTRSSAVPANAASADDDLAVAVAPTDETAAELQPPPPLLLSQSESSANSAAAAVAAADVSAAAAVAADLPAAAAVAAGGPTDLTADGVYKQYIPMALHTGGEAAGTAASASAPLHSASSSDNTNSMPLSGGQVYEAPDAVISP